MAGILLFHAAQGQTPGFHAFSDELRATGHTVHSPDLFDGRTCATIEDGMAYAEELGFPDEIIARGARAAEALPHEIVYAGFSLGVLPAQKLAQTRPGARGALLFYACVPAEFFGPWPAGVPVQIHGMEGRPDLRRRGRHRRGPRARRLGRGRRPLPRPGRSVPALSARSRWGAQAGVQPRAGDRPGRGSRHGPLGSICARFAGGRGRVAPVA
jgi:hypothetical protein